MIHYLTFTNSEFILPDARSRLLETRDRSLRERPGAEEGRGVDQVTGDGVLKERKSRSVTGHEARERFLVETARKPNGEVGDAEEDQGAQERGATDAGDRTIRLQ